MQHNLCCIFFEMLARFYRGLMMTRYKYYSFFVFG